MRLSLFSLLAALLVCCATGQPGLAGQEQQPPRDEPVADADGERQAAVFRGEVEVNEVGLYVTVIGGDGQPVRGLGADDFTVLEDGEGMRVTSCAPVAGPEGAAPVGDVEGHDRYLTLVFDNSSLLKRSRKRILRELEPFLSEWANAGERVMVVAIGVEVETVQAFSSSAAELRAALAAVDESPTHGESLSGKKKVLRRSFLSARNDRVVPSRLNPSGGAVASTSSGGFDSTMGTDGAWALSQAQRFAGDINQLRLEDNARIQRAMDRVEGVLRDMVGLPGRKQVVVVSEDLALRPAFDLYQTFWERFGSAAAQLNLLLPELWSREVTLTREFATLGAVAQAGNVALHILDACDRDRDASEVDFSTTDGATFFSTDPGSLSFMSDYDMTSSQSMAGGCQYLAGVTGGSLLASSRDFESFFRELGSQLGAGYAIAYRRPQAPDGRLHRVEVRVGPEDAEVRHQGWVANPTPEQRLADLAVSRLRLGAGTNPLNFEVSLGGRESAPDGRLIQTIQVTVPAKELLLDTAGEVHRGQIAVVVVVLQQDGSSTPPQLMRFPIQLPAERVTPESRTMAKLRLLLDPGTQRLAVAVRDEFGGVDGTAALDLPGAG